MDVAANGLTIDVEQFGEGRVCGSAGCATVLSRYNRDGLCWGHEQSTRALRDAARDALISELA